MADWQPDPQRVARILAEQNPWHRTGLVPNVLARDVQRPLARGLWRQLLDDGALRRAHVIVGPRRVGKTTVMYQTARNLLSAGIEPSRLWWMRMDHPFLMGEPLGDLVQAAIARSGAVPGREVIAFLDELVYAPDWDLWLKTFHDENWPVRVVATSSATAALRGRHLESGIGRWDEHQMAPYQFVEYLALANRLPDVPIGETLPDTLAHLPAEGLGAGLGEMRRRFAFTGGFPELLTVDLAEVGDEESRFLACQQRLRDEAIERAIYKDIPQSFGVDNPLLLEKLLYLLAAQDAGLLSSTNLSRDLGGVSQPTVDRYISYLEQTFLIFRVPNYSGTEASVQRRGRKLFFFDIAVRNAALQRGVAPLSDPVEMGVVHENLAASALNALAQQAERRMYCWRDGGAEVDLVLDDPESPLAFEVASSTRHSRGGLRKLAAKYPRFAGGCYLVSPDAPTLPPDPGQGEPGSLPLDMFLLLVGRQGLAAAETRLSRSLRVGGWDPADKPQATRMA